MRLVDKNQNVLDKNAKVTDKNQKVLDKTTKVSDIRKIRALTYEIIEKIKTHLNDLEKHASNE